MVAALVRFRPLYVRRPLELRPRITSEWTFNHLVASRLWGCEYNRDFSQLRAAFLSAALRYSGGERGRVSAVAESADELLDVFVSYLNIVAWASSQSSLVGKAGRRVCVVAVRGTNFWGAVACIMSAQTSLNHKEAA